jgi:ADP-ribose pyrophosphatase
MKANTWILDNEKILVSSPAITVIEQNRRSSEDGRAHKFYLLRSRDWCNIIPVTEDGKVVFVKQYRIGISDHTLEVPGGIADPEDKDLASAALREMEEETGYAPLPGARCVPLGWSHPNPAILDNRVHSFIVGPVRKAHEQRLDDGEMIETAEVPIEEIPSLILKGEISHALMLNTFFFLALRNPEISARLAGELQAFSAR